MIGPSRLAIDEAAASCQHFVRGRPVDRESDTPSRIATSNLRWGSNRRCSTSWRRAPAISPTFSILSLFSRMNRRSLRRIHKAHECRNPYTAWRGPSLSLGAHCREIDFHQGYSPFEIHRHLRAASRPYQNGARAQSKSGKYLSRPKAPVRKSRFRRFVSAVLSRGPLEAGDRAH